MEKENKMKNEIGSEERKWKTKIYDKNVKRTITNESKMESKELK